LLRIDFSPLDPDFFFITDRTASSKIYLRPSLVRALHSRYWHLSSPYITVLAVSFVIGADLGSFAFLLADYLRSILLPTKILTAEGTTVCISGYHCIEEELTFLRALVKDEGSTTEKAMRKTSVPG